MVDDLIGEVEEGKVVSFGYIEESVDRLGSEFRGVRGDVDSVIDHCFDRFRLRARASANVRMSMCSDSTNQSVHLETAMDDIGSLGGRHHRAHSVSINYHEHSPDRVPDAVFQKYRDHAPLTRPGCSSPQSRLDDLRRKTLPSRLVSLLSLLHHCLERAGHIGSVISSACHQTLG